MPKIVIIAYNIVGCLRFYIFLWTITTWATSQNWREKNRSTPLMVYKVSKMLWNFMYDFLQICWGATKIIIYHTNSNAYSLPLLPKYLSTIYIGQITFWNVHLYFQICTYLKSVETFEFFLSLGKEMLYFFWTFRHIKRTFWKVSTLFGTQWQTQPSTSCWQPPSQAQWAKRAFTWHTKRFETHNFYDSLGFQDRGYTIEPSQLSHNIIIL